MRSQTTVVIPADGFAVTQGETVVGGAHGKDSHHQHCDGCKSWVFTTFDPAFGFVNVRATMLDEVGWFLPYIETQTAEKLPWAATPAMRSYERFPEVNEYGGLIAEFAERGARP